MIEKYDFYLIKDIKANEMILIEGRKYKDIEIIPFENARTVSMTNIKTGETKTELSTNHLKEEFFKNPPSDKITYSIDDLVLRQDKVIYNDLKLLSKTLDIGKFFKNQIMRKYSSQIIIDSRYDNYSIENVFVYFGFVPEKKSINDYRRVDFPIIKNDLDLYGLLLEKIKKFYKNHGSLFEVRSMKEPYDLRLKDMLQTLTSDTVYDVVNYCVEIYNLYDKINDTDKILDLLERRNRISLSTNVELKMLLNLNEKVEILYTFNSLEELINYQLLISFTGKNRHSIRVCPYCNRFFDGYGKDKFCSPSHKNMYSRKMKKLKEENHYDLELDQRRTKVCMKENCKRIFEPTHQNQKYCESCRK